MKVGWVGLGKLGLPCAMVLAQHHKVYGYDVSDRPWNILKATEEPSREEGFEELRRYLIEEGQEIIPCQGIADVVSQADVIFVAVQTPHAAEYGGEHPLPFGSKERDFDYSRLVQACRDVCEAALRQERHVVLSVVSTVLPGTMDRLIRPLLNSYVQLAYTPLFIAMGTTIADFRNPEFVICGRDSGEGWDGEAGECLREVFLPVHGDRGFSCDIVTAESVKVFYNTFISMKVVWANHVMELCQATGANCDLVVDALSLATERVISPRYMRGGMGDGGACHPRDLIALSWLESRLGTSYPLFGELRHAREEQAKWLAELVADSASQAALPVILLGIAYKPGSDLKDGSPALLLDYYLRSMECPPQHAYDPYCGPGLPSAERLCPAVYVTATRHEEWQEVAFPAGSVVIDVFGYLEDQPGVTLVKVGR